MRRRRIAAIIAAGLLVVCGGGVTWMLTIVPKPAPLAAPGPTGIRIDAGGVFGNYYPGASNGRHAAILLLGGSQGGLESDVAQQALRLQALGFSTLHLAYHNAPGKSARLVNIPLEDFHRGLDWLRAQPGVDRSRIGIVGYSKGAEAALVVATRDPSIRAVVLGMPSSVVWDGMSSANYLLGSFSSSWSERGRPLPHLAYRGFPEDGKLYPVFANALASLDPASAAIIPVEQVQARMMLICGERDTLWPSCPMAARIAARAHAAGRPEIAVLRYADAGHAVMGAPFPDMATATRWSQLGGTPLGNSEAREDSWRKLTSFLTLELAERERP